MNGLGDGTPRNVELNFLKKFSLMGYETVHARLDWRTNQSFTDVFDRVSQKLLQPKLQVSSSIVIIGSSAGGSMAINLFSRFQDKPNIFAINLGGRLARGNLAKHDYRTLDFAAHIGKSHQSQLFYDSVAYCEDTAIPSLQASSLDRLRIMIPFADEVVPVQTMKISDVQRTRIPAVGHLPAALIGGLMIPRILSEFDR